jgi:DNA repair protein RecN (Recombination protein N)
MLREIHIKNFAIIKDLSVSFVPGFNVLTGETGAGKSILIDALTITIGGRANIEHIKSGEKAATITAVFDKVDNITSILENGGISILEDEFLILKRIVSKTDKNRLFINEIPVSLSFVKDISERLLDIHGQNQHQSLYDKNFRLDIIDEFGNLGTTRKEMEDTFNQYSRIAKKIAQLQNDLEIRKKELELAGFQYDELKSANISEDEEKQLESEIRILSNAEKLRITTRNIYDKLYAGESNLYNEIHSIKKDLQDLSSIDQKLISYSKSMEEMEISISEISDSLVGYSENIDTSPNRLEVANARLSLLTKLQRKYGCRSNGDLIKLMENLQEKLASYESKDELLTEDKKLYQMLQEKLKDCAFKLSAKRKEVTSNLENLVVEEFKELGIEKGRFKIDFLNLPIPDGEKKDTETVDGIRFTPRGIDEIDFLFSANPGEELKSLGRVASGGELSRIMLALKTNLAKVDKLDTLIFDEIDAGIGGKIATSVGKRLKKLSLLHQVLVVTHLPQIAAFAKNHIKVEKFDEDDKTSITVEKLDKREMRIQEISRMLSGDLKSSISFKHAEELLQIGENA